MALAHAGHDGTGQPMHAARPGLQAPALHSAAGGTCEPAGSACRCQLGAPDCSTVALLLSCTETLSDPQLLAKLLCNLHSVTLVRMHAASTAALNKALLQAISRPAVATAAVTTRPDDAPHALC
jgi:hypothetical protein